jgi:pilus assembly protein CpaB
MNRRLLIILVSAFVIAAACSYLVYRVVGNRLAATPQRATPVIVAVHDVKLGSVLRDADLTTTEMVGNLPKGAILKREDAVGRGVISDVYQGEPILESRLAAIGSGGGLAATIRQGMRACAVKVDDVVGVAGFVTPGMRVDVLISGNPAELLSLASNQTHIQLVLRNPLDTQLAKTTGTAMSNLFADGSAVKPKPSVVVQKASPPPAPGVYLIEVFNGSKRTEEKFAKGEEKQ